MRSVKPVIEITAKVAENSILVVRTSPVSLLEINATGRPLADKAREVIYWYFAEVTKMKADIGVSEVEKQAARAKERA